MKLFTASVAKHPTGSYSEAAKVVATSIAARTSEERLGLLNDVDLKCFLVAKLW